ncbi:MAG: hypothetical protein ACRC9Q_05680, partial [Bacteroidales bacterium]
MRNILNLILGGLVFLLCNGTLHADERATKKVIAYTSLIKRFMSSIPQERVYLHMDNNAYYQNDQIWFKAYVATTGLDTVADLSRTLYVELLSPGGIVLDKRILEIENGQCHGDFKLGHLPFYSGFYELRAYTKYMLSYGEEIVYRRVFPVFDAPKIEGDFTQKEMQSVSQFKYDNVRPQQKKEKVLNLKMYPEGGALVRGLTSRIAFEVTDRYGNPVDSVSGTIRNKGKEVLQEFGVMHEGKGWFTYTPDGSEHRVELTHNKKSYSFDFPQTSPTGYVMRVDNLRSEDSLYVHLERSADMALEPLGLVVLNRGKLRHAVVMVPSEESKMELALDNSGFESGTAWIALFNQEANVLANRLIYTENPNGALRFEVESDPRQLRPFGPVELGVGLKDAQNKGVQTTFSLAVRDNDQMVDNPHTLMTDLLLMSEIKGYVRNPGYYFDERNSNRKASLDLLLMVQGWNRYYPWKMMTTPLLDTLRYMPEIGIETTGRVVTSVRQTPKPGVDVSFLMHERSDSTRQNHMFTAKTDDQGRFALSTNNYGKMPFILSVTEKGKKKDYRILLDRLFSPEPLPYALTDLQYEITQPEQEENERIVRDKPFEENLDSVYTAFEDSLKRRGIDEKVHRLKEVDVRAKKAQRENDVYRTRSTSVAYYDMTTEVDKLTDQGEYIGNNLVDVLRKINPKFSYFPSGMLEASIKELRKKQENRGSDGTESKGEKKEG